MKKIGFIKDAIILCIITMISGLLLGTVYEITKEPIAIAQENIKQKAYQQVFPKANSFQILEDKQTIMDANKILLSKDLGNVMVEEVVNALDSSNAMLGYVIITKSKDGYGGDIKIAIGITKEGNINGIAYLVLAETPGLGMRAKEEKFIMQFSNRKLEKLVVVKSGATKENEIDAISGATITSKAVVNAVNTAIFYIDTVGGGA